MNRLASSHRLIIVIATISMASAGCAENQFSKVKTWNPFAGSRKSDAAEFASSSKGHDQHDIQLKVARSLEQQGEIDRAIMVYSRIAETDDRADVLHRLAVLHDQKGNAELAEKHFQAAIVKSKGNVNVLCDYGYSLYLRGQLDRADKILRQALSRNPHDARAHNNLGLVLARLGNSDEALVEFSRSGCTEAQAQLNLNHARLWFENPQEAKKLLHLAQSPEDSSPVIRPASFTKPQVSVPVAKPQRKQQEPVVLQPLPKIQEPPRPTSPPVQLSDDSLANAFSVPAEFQTETVRSHDAVSIPEKQDVRKTVNTPANPLRNTTLTNERLGVPANELRIISDGSWQ